MNIDKEFLFPQFILILMLLWAMVPGNPPLYYTFLRWVAFSVFMLMAAEAASLDRGCLAFISFALAIIFNPFSRVYLDYYGWVFWDIMGIFFIAYFSWSINRKPKEGIHE